MSRSYKLERDFRIEVYDHKGRKAVNYYVRKIKGGFKIRRGYAVSSKASGHDGINICEISMILYYSCKDTRKCGVRGQLVCITGGNS
jgi:hypothetical protein